MEFEVSEVLNVLKHHLFTHTKNAGFVSLADVKGNFIYVWIDDVEYFDNVDQADAAQRDVNKFVSFWKSRGKKLYNKEV